MKYRCLSEYAIRVSGLPEDDRLWDRSEKELEKKIYDISRDSLFKEAVLVASESLYNEMLLWHEGKIKNAKKVRRVVRSLLEYYIRMCDRVTPFGPFASIMAACGDNIKDHRYSPADTIRRLNVDYEWLYDYVRTLERRHLEKLSFTFSRFAYVKAPYLCVPFIPGVTDKEVKIEPDSDAVTMWETLKKTGQWIHYADLSANVRPDSFAASLSLLVDNNVILTNLMPMPDDPEPIGHILSILGDDFARSEEGLLLTEIKERINAYNDSNKADDIALNGIIRKLADIHNSEKYIQLDTVHEKAYVELTKEDCNNIQSLVDILTYIASKMNVSDMIYEEYKDLYYERFGEYREIRLIDVLDPEYGISIPQTYKNYRKKKKGVKSYGNRANNEFVQWFYRRYVKAVKNHEAIDLSERDIVLPEEGTSHRYPSCYMIGLIPRMDPEGNTILYFNHDLGMYSQPNNIWGRFTYFSDDLTELTKAVCRIEEDKDRSVHECVQLKYIPDRVRWANVMRNKSMLSCQLSMYPGTGESSIGIEDIMTGIRDDRFYLKNVIDGQCLKIRTFNMFSYNKEPDVIRFLKEVGEDGMIKDPCSLWNEQLTRTGYMPEIRYKNIVVFPESWYFTDKDLCGIDSIERFKKAYFEIANSEGIPDLVYLCEGDSKQLINTRHSYGTELLYKQFIKHRGLTLKRTEKGKGLLYSKEGLTYQSEILMPLHIDIDPAGIEKPLQMEDYVHCDEEYLVPGDEWIFFKLYGVRIGTENYIVRTMDRISAINEHDKLFDKYFYVRYRDDLEHIRLRLHITGNKSYDDAYKTCVECFKDQIRNKEITYYEIGSYTRETERYGGRDAVERAETVFSADSALCEYILRNDFMGMDRDLWGVSMISFYLDASGMGLSEQHEWLDRFYSRDELREKFTKFWNENKGILCRKNGVFDLYKNDRQLAALSDALRKAIGSFSAIMENKSKSRSERAIDGLIHMSFNRLFGMDRDLEKKYRIYIRNILYKLVEKGNNYHIYDNTNDTQ